MLSTAPLASTSSSSNVASPDTSVPFPPLLLVTVSWDDSVQVPVGRTPAPLPQETDVPPAKRRAAPSPWLTKPWIDIPERLAPTFWSVAVYAMLAPSISTVFEGASSDSGQ